MQKFHILLNNYFPALFCQLLIFFIKKMNKFITGRLSEDFNCLSVVGENEKEEVYLITINCNLIHSRKLELIEIANESFQISILLQQSASLVSDIIQKWAKSFKSFSDHFNIYNKLLQGSFPLPLSLYSPFPSLSPLLSSSLSPSLPFPPPFLLFCFSLLFSFTF